MRIGELASKLDISRDTVRLYDQIGLLKDVNRPYEHNNYKDYGEVNIERIKLVKKFQQFGFTLKECKTFLETFEGENPEDAKELIERKLIEIENKIVELKQVHKLLKESFKGTCDSHLKK